MGANAESMVAWTRALMGADGFPDLTLEQYLADIPTLDSLGDLPAGTVVVVRGDTDCKPGAKVGDGDIRLRSMRETLEFGRAKGWKQVVLGHIGRDPCTSLYAVRQRLSDILGVNVAFYTNWLDPVKNTIRDSITDAIKKAKDGSVILLENTRIYDIERKLWKAKPDDLPKEAPALAQVANEVAAKIGSVFVNEAFSAGSLDASSTVLPAAMTRVALGKYAAEQFSGPMLRCLKAQLVVFSGLKADKLDDMEAIIRRGHVRKLFVAGSLAMVMKKADAQLQGGDFHIGFAEEASHVDAPFYVPAKRLEQAKKMLTEGRQAGIEFVLPVDFTLTDGTVSETIGPGRIQLDIGPKTNAFFSEKVGEFIAAHRSGANGDASVAFHNGVFGKFEEAPFERGTKEFVAEFKRMKDAGIEVYVGGGEGGTALERFGGPDWVTHCFTAGGTVLNALGSDPVPYLVALRMAALQAK
ncbi:MAG: phosphoglycerate kinase [Pirellulales bacterium]